jgi:CheY-like chemotaxis protein
MTGVGRDPRVLVVEDDDEIAQVLQRSLRLDGYDVRIAGDGEAALDQAAAYHPDLVILDLGLPKIDGIEVARRLRRHPGLAGARLISLTGYGQPEDIRGALAAGFEAHLTKPINLDQLLDLLGAPGDEGTPERKDSRWTS